MGAYFPLFLLLILFATAAPAASEPTYSLADGVARHEYEAISGDGDALIRPPKEAKETQAEGNRWIEVAQVDGERRIPLQSWDGVNSVADRPFVKLATDNLDWEFYWSYTKQAPPRPLQEGAELAVFVFIGARDTGGYRAVIEGLTLDGNKARVEWIEVTPAEGALVTQARSYPWAIALFRHNGADLTLIDSPGDVRTASPGDADVIGLPKTEEFRPEPPAEAAPEIETPTQEMPSVKVPADEVPSPEVPLVVEPAPGLLFEETPAPAPDTPQEPPTNALQEAPAKAPSNPPLDLYLPPPLEETPTDEDTKPFNGTLY